MIPVSSDAICPLGIVSPGFRAFCILNSNGSILISLQSLLIALSIAKHDCVTPKPLKAPDGTLFVYRAIPVISIF